MTSSLASLQAWAARAVAAARSEMASPAEGGVRTWSVGVPAALSLELRVWPISHLDPAEEGWAVSVHVDGEEVDMALTAELAALVLSMFEGPHVLGFWKGSLRFQASLLAAGVDVGEMAREALVRDVMSS